MRAYIQRVPEFFAEKFTVHNGFQGFATRLKITEWTVHNGEAVQTIVFVYQEKEYTLEEGDYLVLDGRGKLVIMNEADFFKEFTERDR